MTKTWWDQLPKEDIPDISYILDVWIPEVFDKIFTFICLCYWISGVKSCQTADIVIGIDQHGTRDYSAGQGHSVTMIG